MDTKNYRNFIVINHIQLTLNIPCQFILYDQGNPPLQPPSRTPEIIGESFEDSLTRLSSVKFKLISGFLGRRVVRGGSLALSGGSLWSSEAPLRPSKKTKN